MLKSYLTTAWRNIRKNKIFSFINVIGLSIGMAACLLILQYVNFELSYDQFNKNVGDLYRVYNDRYQNGKLIQHGTITYSAIGKAMQNDFPEVVDHSRMEPFGNQIITSGTTKFGDQPVLGVDNSFLSMFSYDLIAGDPRSALTQPYTAVLTESAAARYFGVKGNSVASVLGKTFIMGNDSLPFKVTGICRDVPENSHLSFTMLVSYVTMLSGRNPYKEADYDFKDSDFWHYIQLRHGSDYKALEARLPAFSDKYFQGNKVSGSVEKFYLQPLSRAHLYSDFEYEIGQTGSATVVWGLLIIALFIIVIAWVNYVNLSTARSVERAKEVGVRKVIGAEKAQLIRQFLTESFLINILALVLGIGLMLALQPAFNALIGHKLSFVYLLQKSMGGYSITIGLLTLVLAGIFVSGFYPAFVLSSFRPILVLKGRFSTSKGGIVLRKALVVGQFAITVVLIIGSFVVYRQIRFMNNQQLGMNIDRMLMIKPPELTHWDSTFINRENTFSLELGRLPGVVGAASSWNQMGGETGRSFDIRRADQDNTTHYTMRNNGISYGFIPLYQMKLVAGRDYAYSDFNPDFRKLHNIIVNESAVKLLGFKSPQDAIGKTIMRGDMKWDIVGVINDYHQKSLRFPVEPTMLIPAYSNGSMISVKVNTSDMPSTIAAIKKTYDAFFPGNYFDYYFLDDHYNEQYANDRLFGKAFGIFAGFAIFIACLGLLGLSLFATMQRTKEIGVRKVLGASVGNIVVLLSADFIRLVIVAIIIATPIAWFILHKWLQDFAYRIDIGWWVFVVAGLLAVAIALATISWQAMRAAVANPVKALRSE
ncbi:MAG TPA: ABC transporter permease [Puia sp.]|jgi:putative ABC transport system permease protein|nr:ABC transporter permease [Puia sp.]